MTDFTVRFTNKCPFRPRDQDYEIMTFLTSSSHTFRTYWTFKTFSFIDIIENKDNHQLSNKNIMTNQAVKQTNYGPARRINFTYESTYSEYKPYHHQTILTLPPPL